MFKAYNQNRRYRETYLSSIHEIYYLIELMEHKSKWPFCETKRSLPLEEYKLRWIAIL